MVTVLCVTGPTTHLRAHHHDLRQLQGVSPDGVEDILQFVYDGYERLHPVAPQQAGLSPH